MLITASCPFCRSAYQVQATLRGQMVRCPNGGCRKVFAVPLEEPSATPSPASPPRSSPLPDNGQRSGAVGEMVPILPAEQAGPPTNPGSSSQHVFQMLPMAPAGSDAPAPEQHLAEADWWQSAPPVRQPANKPDAASSVPPRVEEPPSAPEPLRGASSPSSPPPQTTWWNDAPPPVRTPPQPTAPSAPAPSAPRTRPVRSTSAPAERTRQMRADAAERETQQMPALPPETAAQPRELPPGMWEPPPVRRGASGGENGTPPPPAAASENLHRPRLSKRRAWFVIIGLFVLTFGILGSVGVLVSQKVFRSEEMRYDEARKDYQDGSFSKAESEFQQLLQNFPTSTRADEYRFLVDWCAVCRAASDPDADPSGAAAQLEAFIKGHKQDPFMSQYGHDAGQQLLRLTTRFAARNANPQDVEPLKDAQRIEDLRATVSTLSAEALTKEETQQINAELGKVRHAVELASKRRNVLAQIKKQDNETWMDSITRVRALLARMERELPGIEQDADAHAGLSRLYDEHLTSVAFHPRQEDVPPPPPRPEDDAETIVFAPLLPRSAPGNAPSKDPIVLALVRGVLYALKQSTGEVVWATRVGVDTTVLPLRVPASPASPELLLVLSADTQTLSALNLNGDSLWEYPVGQRVLGRPIIIDHRAYLAAYDGWIHEIELSRGQLLGRWYLGQRLTCGGAREGKTGRIYFPADDSCVYVLDVSPKARRCVTILYDGHRSGSLRSEPIIIPPESENAPGYLILNQSSGLDAMQLRVFELPVQDRHATPLTLKPPARLAGWTWFEPYQDGEKLAVLSDAGILGLFGIRQLGNRDQALFPLLETGGLDLSPFLKNEERDLPHERGRSQVVHMQDNDFWVLAHGRFQQMQLRWKAAQGPQPAAGWKAPLTLGSPLHEPQRIEDRQTGLSSVVLVTQALEQQTCLATKVDRDGKLQWQRQLGLVCQGQPLALTPPEGGPPLLLALDQGGGLFVLDPKRPSKPHYLAPALDENPRVPPRLLLGPDGRSAYEVAAPGEGRTLLVRRIEWGSEARELRVRQIKVPSVSNVDHSVLVPAGVPAVAGTQMIVPTTDGTLRRLALDEDQEMMQPGPTWRDDSASVAAPCNVLPLGGDRFLVTDGSRGLRVYEWPAGKTRSYQGLPKGEDDFLKLEYLVAAPPVLLPPQEDKPRFAVVDSAGVLHLFTVAADGSLKPGPTHDLQGKLTAGPFVHTTPKGETRLGCVLDRHRLVWLDPTNAGELWTYSSAGAAFIGQPTQVEGLLVVALQSGQYLGLDPDTGQPKGTGYTLRTSTAPAATPMSFGQGRMFTPLSDGTALLLAVELLREPAKK